MSRLKSLLCLLAAAPLIGTAHATDLRTAIPEPIPDTVVTLANLYAASHPGSESTGLIQAYAGYFFHGFLNPGGHEQSSSDLERSAYEQGQSLWLAQPADRELIYLGYGYTRVDAYGTWTIAWELNRFVPDDHPDESWNMAALSGSLGRAPPHALPGRDGAHVHVIGHVSAPVARKYPGGPDRFLIAAFVVRADDPACARWPGAGLGTCE